MAALLTRRVLVAMRLRQPYRLKNWCEKKEGTNPEATIRHASQESLYKDYDLNRCKKTVFCAGTRLDCAKQPQPKPPCGPKKKTTADMLGKMIWVCIKGGVVLSLVYVTVDAGLWKGSDHTYELAKTLYKRILEVLNLDDSRMPTSAEVKYNAVQTWNAGVKTVFNRIANPLPDYETYQTQRKTKK